MLWQHCAQIVILSLYTVGTQLAHFQIAKTFKLMSFELEEVEIPTYYELLHGLEQSLGHIQHLEVAVHLECQFRLAAEAANRQM